MAATPRSPGLRHPAPFTRQLQATLVAHQPIVVQVGQATESDVALAATARKTVIAGQALENDAGLLAAARKVKLAGQALETDTPLAIARTTKTKMVGLAAEAVSALAAAVRKVRLAGQGQETSSALAPIARKIRAAGQPVETSQALAAESGGGQTVAAGQAIELEGAHAIARTIKIRSAGQANEVATAQPSAARKVLRAALALELDQALATATPVVGTRGFAVVTSAAAGSVVIDVGQAGHVQLASLDGG